MLEQIGEADLAAAANGFAAPERISMTPEMLDIHIGMSTSRVWIGPRVNSKD